MELSRRAACRAQLTKIVNAASEFLNQTNTRIKKENNENFDTLEEEILSLIQRLKAAQDNVDKANHEAQHLIKPEEVQKDCETMAEYQDKAIAARTRLEHRLKKLRSFDDPLIGMNSLDNTMANVSQNNKGLSSVKLPKMELKRFTGKQEEWLTFWEQFRIHIHENTSLSGAEKFGYLESLLTGRAADTIAGFIPTEACYDGAIALLKEQFGCTERIIDKNMQGLMALSPIISRVDVLGLRQLYNSVMSCTRSLTALGISSSNYSLMLKSILLKCLPNDLRVEFYRRASSSNNEVLAGSADSNADENDEGESSFSFGDGNVKCLMEFLKREVESLEKAGIKPSRQSNEPSRRIFKTAAGLMTTSEGKSAKGESDACFFCNSRNHGAINCDAVLSADHKKEILKRNGRCFRCLTKGHAVKSCKVYRICCNKCGRRHATSMCTVKNTPLDLPNRMDSNVDVHETLKLCAPLRKTAIFLQTASVIISSQKNSKRLRVRLILDGGSQLSFIREELSRKLNLPVVGKERLSVIAFGNNTKPPMSSYNKVRIAVNSQYNNKLFTFDAIEVPEICVDILSAPDGSDPRFCDLELADVCHEGVKQEPGIGILIGADYFWKFVTGGTKRITEKLTAIHTVFGWTLQGPNSTESLDTDISAIQNLWRLETIGIKCDEEEDDSFTIKYMNNCIAKSGPRYEIKLPWKEGECFLRDNRNLALSRLHSLTRRLLRDEKRLLQYDDVMWDHVNNGVIEPILSETRSSRVYYLPHQPVYREDKATTKLRIVFDASSHIEGSPSLNQCIKTGPNLLPQTLRILINFRFGNIGLIADIEKAFLQISIAKEDRDSHRLLWYKEKLKPNQELPSIQEFRLNRLTFGVSSSPFILGATIRKHLDAQSTKFPETSNILKECFYMDDLILSVSNKSSAQRLYHEAINVMEGASMKLHKWNSNSKEIRSCFTQSEPCPAIQKVLGIVWHVRLDELTVDISSVSTLIATNLKVNKRNILRTIASFYDPFGLLAPFVIRLKIFFQTLWRLKVNWDEPLANEQLREWHCSCNKFESLKELSIPRNVMHGSVIRQSLHMFSDASLQAYGAVAYLRNVTNEGKISVQILCAKNRVSPLKEDGSKELTLPRLELTAALLSARLFVYLKRNISVDFESVTFWCDSKITLYWIQGNGDKWVAYVLNRVTEIKGLSNQADWKHCPGCDNPADLLTRGIPATTLLRSITWRSGPSWLQEHPRMWPAQSEREENLISLISLHHVNKAAVELPDPVIKAENFSSLRKLLRITSYVFRFIRLAIRPIRHKKFNSHILKDLIENPDHRFLTAEEVLSAKNYWVRHFQRMAYSAEMEALKSDGAILRSSRVFSLDPFLDEEGCLRVKGRLSCFQGGFNSAHPLLLPKSAHLSELLVRDLHNITLHSGVGVVLAKLREHFWIPQARQLVNRIIKNCIICKRLFGKPATQPFGQLPKERMMETRPFATTGVDFAGPLYVKQPDEESSRKVYIMLLTCGTTRAVFLELILDLSTESCISALRRFFGRRGVPDVMFSDNARTFKRASVELSALAAFVQSEELHGFVSQRGIKWKFIVERAPWWGGFWERMVKSVKTALKSTLGRAVLSLDQLQTLLVEVESIINSRPLTYVSNEPLDLLPLSPSHFLLGSVPSPLSLNVNTIIPGPRAEDLRLLWNNRLKATRFFWKRWRTEYLQQLRSLHHFVNKSKFTATLKPGDVVIVEDKSVPRILWRLAVINEVFVGRDKRVRACIVKLSNGSRLRRPIQLLYPLEISETPICRPEDVKNNSN